MRGGVEAIIADDIPGQTGRAAESEGDSLFAGVARVQQGRAVGHLDDVRGVAGRRHIEDGEAGVTILQGVQHCGDEITRVQRPRLARLQIDPGVIALTPARQAGAEQVQIIARLGNVMPATHVDPAASG